MWVGQDASMTTGVEDATDAPAGMPIVRVFDGMGLDVDGPVSVGGPRQRRLLALLAIRPNVVLSIDWLSEYLWDDQDRPDPPAPNLRTYMSRLRRVLPDGAREWIETGTAGYRFVVPEEALEHRRFSILRAEARQARDREDPLRAQQLLDDALRLWRGEPFRELEDLDWARAEIEQLRADRLEALEERWEAALALGRHTQITGELAAFTAEHGDRGRAVRQYALALHRSGRTPEALRVIQDHRRMVVEESGLDLTAELAELETALLRGDPSLDVEKVGRPLRGYRLLEQIGAGAFSVVWRGVQPSVDREVAIKQIRSELASKPDFIRRFEAEAHLVARIEHPHVVPLIDYWRDPDSAYLVMRWLRGGTLERLLDDGPFGVDRTLTLAREIGGALAAAHAQGVVHRDVKAANILFDEAGNSYLSDFGIALEAAESSGSEAALSPGSPAYAAPEQLRRQQLGPQADVFSLGVVVFECLAGALPFPDASSATELTRRQLETPFPSLTRIRSDVPPAIAAAVATATAKDPVDRFATIESFVATLEQASTTGATRTGARSVVSGDVGNPYKGLRAFDGGDVDDFFGRDALVAELIARLSGDSVAARCIAVLGPSGSGKSSVVRAGLTPALRAGAVPGSADWFITTMVPGADPFESLEAALLRIAVNPPPSLLSQLRNGHRGILRSVRRCLDSDDDSVVVIIDQFEELFTVVSPEDAHRFLDALSVAVEDPTSPLRVVLTLRADYYDRPLAHPSFARLVKQGATEVTPLAPDELEAVIVEPARRVGVEFEPGLVARIAAETLGQPSPLPLLQYTLALLFERREGTRLTSAAYEQLGGLSGALASRAEALHDEATEAARDAIRVVFGRLTNPTGEAADLRRRVVRSDIDTSDATTWVIDAFGAARLLTFDRDASTREPTVEVAHEALLREWPRLARWLLDDRELLGTVEAVAMAATAWDQGGRASTDLYRGGRLEAARDLVSKAPDRLRPIDSTFIDASQHAAASERHREERRVRRLRRLVAGIGTALVLAVVAGGLAFRQQQRADEEAQRADEQAERAEGAAELADERALAAIRAADEAELATLISRSAATRTDQPEVSILLALEAHRRAPGPETEQAVLTALGGSTLGTRIAAFERFPPTRKDGVVPWLSADAMSLSTSSDGTMYRQSLETREVVEVGELPEPDAVWVGDPASGRQFAHALDLSRFWFGPYGGDWEVELDPGETMQLVGDQGRGGKAGTLAANRLVFATFDGTYIGDGVFEVRGAVLQTLVLLDATTGERVGPGIEGLSRPRAVLSADGRLIAVRSEPSSVLGADGAIFVLDAATGAVVRQIRVPSPAGTVTPSGIDNTGGASIAFDSDAGQLLAGVAGGRLVTFDLESGTVAAEVETNAASSIIDVDLRADGRVVVVSNGLAELVDRRRGPIAGSAIELRDAVQGVMRSDDTLLITNSDLRRDVHDFDGGALVEQAIELEAGTDVALGAGASAMLERRGRFELLDVVTGDRTDVNLTTSTGESFIPMSLDDDSVLVFSIETLIGGRWMDGQIVERLKTVDDGAIPILGTFAPGRNAGVSLRPDGAYEVTLLDTRQGQIGELMSVVENDDTCTAYPARADGLHVMLCNGTLRTYDSSGAVTGEVATEQINLSLARGDEASGRLAFGGPDGRSTVVVIDPAIGDSHMVPDATQIANLTFARDGELLAILELDGTLRLWDVERQTTAGILWDGAGAGNEEPLWYDDTTDSLWLSTGGRLLRLPLSPQRWVERACTLVGRDFTQDEWDRFVPGDAPLTSACT